MKLHTITQLGILTATSVLAFIGGIITADLHKASTVAAAPDPYPAAVESSLSAEIDRLKNSLSMAQEQASDAKRQLIADKVRTEHLQLTQQHATENQDDTEAEVIALQKDLAVWKGIAANWEATAAANKTQADQNYDTAEQNYTAAESWKQAAQTLQASAQASAQATPTLQPAAVPNTLDTLAQMRREQAERQQPQKPKSRISHIIDTGYGTATVINPDGTHSFIQSTGEGTAIITTPGR